MFTNPFSPIFGGKPGVFFGRERILDLFDHAMIDTGSDDRAMFITGTRGSGKTALLEQLSIRAGAKKRVVIDLGPENTIAQLIHELAGYDEVTKTVSPQSLLLEKCSNAKKGILVTVDEVQKVPVEDVSSLCNAFQMASRKGYDIMLVVAGLPYAYSEIIKHEGCTYLRRASHEELGLFTWEEAEDAFSKMFSGIRGLKIDREIIDELNKVSFGQPYLMQLLGYHLIQQINDHDPEKKHTVTKTELRETVKNALFAYEQRALKPLMEELPNGEKAYLTKMSECLDAERLAATIDIARSMGGPQNKLSRSRAYLIDQGIIAAPERGKVMFCIPYLADYVKKEESVSSAVEIARQRKV